MPYVVEYLIIKEFDVDELDGDSAVNARYQGHFEVDTDLAERENLPEDDGNAISDNGQVIIGTVRTIVDEDAGETDPDRKGSVMLVSHYATVFYPDSFSDFLSSHTSETSQKTALVTRADNVFRKAKLSYSGADSDFLYYMTVRSRASKDDTKNVMGYASSHVDYGDNNTFVYFVDDKKGVGKIDEDKFKTDFISIGRKGADKTKDLPQFE